MDSRPAESIGGSGVVPCNDCTSIAVSVHKKAAAWRPPNKPDIFAL